MEVEILVELSHNWLQWPSDHRNSLSVPEGLTDFDNVARTHPYTYVPEAT